jgi:succinate dehydrogenase/fumarate reductase-like Fe-S protein
MGRLHALLLLAWALVRSLLAPLFGTRRGLADFRRSYAPDRVPPISPEERTLMPAFSRCIACGLCDVGEGAAIVRSRGAYAGVMDLMLASSRNIPDFDVAAASFDAVGDERLAALEARCPTAVPMRRLAAFVRAKAAEASEAARDPLARRDRDDAKRQS